MSLLVQRVIGLLSRPRQTLEENGVPPPPPSVIVTRHLLPLLIATSGVLILVALLGGPTMPMLDPEAAAPGLIGLVWFHVKRIVLELLIVAVAAWLIQAFTAFFGGLRSFDHAFAASGLAVTPTILASAVAFVPGIGRLTAIAAIVYGIMLLYWSLEVIVQAPSDRRGVFCAAVVVAMLVATFLLTMIFASLLF